MAHVHEHEHRMFCLTTGFANGSIDPVQRQLDHLNAEAKEVAAKLYTARADLRQDPGNQVLRETVDDLKKEKAGLYEWRKTLKAKLAGATHADLWHSCLLVSAQQVP